MTHKAEQGSEQWIAARVGHHLPMRPWPQTSFQLGQGGTRHRVRGPSHLEAPSPHDLQSSSPSPPHCPASAPPRCTGCQVIAPHGHGMEVFRKRKKEKSPRAGKQLPGVAGQDGASGCPAPSSIHLQPGTETGPACGAGSTPSLWHWPWSWRSPGGRHVAGGSSQSAWFVGKKKELEGSRGDT